MGRLTKRVVDAAEPGEADYFLWDDDLPGFGLRVFKSGKRSYLVQYRSGGRSRRFTIGLHGVWTVETARKEAHILLGKIAQGENPAEQKLLDIHAITVKELCGRYMTDSKNGLIMGKGRRPKKASTVFVDNSRVKRHILPLLGNRRVKDITSADVTKFMKDVAAGKTALDVKTKRRGRAIVRGEIVNIRWAEVDAENSCLRLIDSKEGASTRPAGLSVIDALEAMRSSTAGPYVFPGTQLAKPLIGFPKYWNETFKKTEFAKITPHLLRHSFASIAHDLGFTEVTIAALLGHSRGTIKSRYIHTIDAALVMAAYTVAGYIQGLLDGVTFKRNAYFLDRSSREAHLPDCSTKPKTIKSLRTNRPPPNSKPLDADAFDLLRPPPATHFQIDGPELSIGRHRAPRVSAAKLTDRFHQPTRQAA